MKLGVVAAVVVGCALAWGARAPHAETAIACGRELWALKTLSDPQRTLVRLRPRNTTVPAIDKRGMPRPTPTTRSTPYARQVWRVKAQITEYRLEADSDIHLILFAGGTYLIAEMPSPACLPARTRDRRAIINARRLFESRCGAATDQWRSLGAVAEIAGVGFWDFPRFTLRVYAQATKRRERLSGPHLKAYDAALEWARMGTNDALTVDAVPAEATKNPV